MKLNKSYRKGLKKLRSRELKTLKNYQKVTPQIRTSEQIKKSPQAFKKWKKAQDTITRYRQKKGK